MAKGKTLKVSLEHRKDVVLTDHNHIATGGEGSVYRADADTVVKVYTDDQKMRQDNMPEKFRLLAGINHLHIAGPKGLAIVGGKPIGYWAPYVEGMMLPPFFTTDHRQQVGFGDKETNDAVGQIREVVLAAHGGGATLVDPNELNWLLHWGGKGMPEVSAIDVDAWAIGRWGASVIMPSIRDYHANGFTFASDWFSVGIVTFQLYTGIHPYKGTLDGYARKDLVKRMQDNTSVFTPGVRLNAAVRDPYKIPGPLLDWYIATFQNGERTEMPSPFATGVAVTTAGRILRVVTSGQGSLTFEKIFADSQERVVRMFPCGVVLLSGGSLADLSTKQRIGGNHSTDCEVISVENGWLVGEMKGKNVAFSFIGKSQPQKEVSIPLQAAGQRVVRYENRLFVVTNQSLAEIAFFFVPKGPLVSVGKSWDVLVNSTRWFDGVGVMDAIGSMFIVAPFGTVSCGIIRVRELDGLRPIAARSGNGFISIVAADKNGDYRKIELTMKPDYSGYEYWSGMTDVQSLNVAFVPKTTGCVQVAIVEDGKMDVYVPTNKQQRTVADRTITTDMILGVWGDKVLYIKDGAVWRVRMK